MYITLYFKNVSIIFHSISILIDFSKLNYYSLFNSSKDFRHYHKIPTNFVLRLILNISEKYLTAILYSIIAINVFYCVKNPTSNY